MFGCWLDSINTPTFLGPNKGSFVGRWLPPMRDGLDSSFSSAGPNLDSADGPISPHRQEMAAFHQ